MSSSSAAIGQSLTGEPYSAQRLRMVVTHVLDDWREPLDERLAEAARAVDAPPGREVTGDWERTVHNGSPSASAIRFALLPLPHAAMLHGGPATQ